MPRPGKEGIKRNRDHRTQARSTHLGCMTFFLAHIAILACGAVSFALTPEGEALLVFKAGVRDTRGVLDNWRLVDADPCQWKGVVCDQHKHVISLNLPYKHLWGSISPALGKLEQLRRLSLHENNLFGALPAELGNCNKLKALYLHDNFLSGHIPAQLGSLSNLMILDISGNSLTGSIPPSLGNLKKLKHLNISTNFLVGKIPQTGVLGSFSSTSFLGNLDLCGDQLATICKSELSGPSVINEPNAPNAKTKDGEPSKAPPSYVNSLLIGAMTTMGVSFALVVMCFWGYILYNRAATKDEITKPVVLEEPKIKINVFHGDLPYTSQSIMKKIELLDEADIIGSGGFGTVYKLAMDENNVFAIKRIEKNGKFCERIFERELEILGILRHRNLVNLRGYCNADSMNLLIYDFLSNGSLESLLYGSPEVAPLSWADRIKIAIGTAKGLSYLHHDCCPTILHRDIKSSNILLDENLEPHLADFGLAKLLEETETHMTTVLAGTFGYLAPEYMQSGMATTKTDVYSYGVLLLELISGRRPTEISFVEKGLNLVGWVEVMMKDKKHREILDCRCHEGGTNESLEAMLAIAVACVSAHPEGRPPMNKVVQLLEVETMSPCPSDFYDSCSD